MNDTKRREAWLRELKELRKQLLSKNEVVSNDNVPTSYSNSPKTFQKSVPGMASKMYESDRKNAAKIQVLMLAFLTFIFEILFFIGSYFLFKK
ncbi:MAG: hypothetical protein HFH08_01675 [Bacilli bacterium]|nr:hypothetical protein [Bacilli bacterium]